MDSPRQHTDGRVARGERTRRAIVAAHAALLREGVLKPTGQAIAERAEVSVRTLWANFHDLEALLSETTAFWMDADDALRQSIDTDLPLGERITTYTAERCRRLESIAPAARSAALGEPFSAALKRGRATHIGRVRTEVETTFAREIAAAGTGASELVLAIVAAAGWPCWAMLRDDLGLSKEEALAVMRRTLNALLS